MNKYLDNLPLVKIMIYEMMKDHFEPQLFPGITYTNLPSDLSAREDELIATIKDLSASLKGFRVKMAAAMARIRIEKRAVGDTFEEMMRNILPAVIRQKEETAGNSLL